MQCGAINGAEARTCCLCDTRLSKNVEVSVVSASAQLKAEVNPTVEVDWRTEVFRQVEAYQVRHGHPRHVETRPEAVFSPSPPPQSAARASGVAEFEAPPATITKRRFRPARVERLEINVEQSSFDFSGKPIHAAHNANSGYEAPVPSVASLAERRRAAALDVAFLSAAYMAFLMLFHALGGRFNFTRLDALVTLATMIFLYAQYIAFFTYFAQATPGMMLRGLSVAGLDGLDPSRRQLFWRSVGYLISAGTLMLGFVWAVWDEDQLCWHDRISQTCVTADFGRLADSCRTPSAIR